MLSLSPFSQGTLNRSVLGIAVGLSLSRASKMQQGTARRFNMSDVLKLTMFCTVWMKSKNIGE